MSHQQRNCASLIFKDAKITKQYSLSTTGVVIIGRSPDCQIALDPFKFITVSRRHAKIKRVGAHWQIEDLGTTNGTLVNDLPIHGIHKLRSAIALSWELKGLNSLLNVCCMMSSLLL
ncbi:MAG: FHA domain-containing protein [Pleurocapsa sp. SU_5_0]|nr:FHA domain-containing protein [Pleurocapsa sp. SU_5_0]NJO96851.1 FHA domain-containing protein [Pleurocapsa sp. CRU_1_2]NJR47730.1 FHA domain-containing protein [Hyellaceae cyanobacterium CSU_1_1]